MEIANVATETALRSTGANTFAELGSEDFLQLLITQITNQDPLEPMGNAELLEQLSLVRELEVSTTLTDTLQRLAGQDRFSSAPSLIGKFVSSSPGADGLVQSGVVLGVRFTDDGRPLLQLSDGTELPIERVLTVEAPLQAAEALVGQSVTGIDRRRTFRYRDLRGPNGTLSRSLNVTVGAVEFPDRWAVLDVRGGPDVPDVPGVPGVPAVPGVLDVLDVP